MNDPNPEQTLPAASDSLQRLVVPLSVISLGAGVQSSTMALMAKHGEITPMPDAAIFADTQAEPKAVYEWLDYLEKQLPFPVYRVTAGNLTAEIGRKRVKGRFRVLPIPAFVKVGGKIAGMINRSCTRDFKIDPIRKKLRELCGLYRKRSPKHVVAKQWIGISSDEYHRMKPSREPWIENIWPLIDLRMSRNDCLEWMKKRDYPRPPKSSCVYCPYHGRDQWAALTPDEMAEAVKVDETLRAYPDGEIRAKGILYLHRSGMPLKDINFRKPERPDQLDLWGNECEGVCGV